MIPSSFRQIQETGRMRQQALLAAAERERRLDLALAGEPAPETAAGARQRPAVGAVDRLLAVRVRLALLVGAVLRPRATQP